MPHPAPLTRASLLCSTFINVMHTACANTAPFAILSGALSLPAMRISGPNLRTGNGA